MSNHTDVLKKNFNHDDVMVLVPLALLNSINKKQDELLYLLKGQRPVSSEINGYISSDEAMTMLKRGTTWFWNMRKQGRLTGMKVGGKRHYSMEEIEKLFNQ